MAAGLVCGCCLLAQSSDQAPKSASSATPVAKKKEAPASTPLSSPSTQALVDSLSDADLHQAIDLLKANYFNPNALGDKEMVRATLAGLIARLTPGASILQTSAADATGTSPFRSEILDERIGYLRLGGLTKEAAGELDAALKNFADKSLTSAVLDLRATPPSSDFAGAAEIIKRFASKGKTLFSIKKPGVKLDQVFTSDQDPLFQGIMAVLVDRDDAGAAEVIAAVIRAQTGALVIGETTRGEAVEYAELPLHDGKILRIAEAQVMLPENQAIYPQGVKPDLIVKLPEDAKRQIMAQSLKTGISPFVFEAEHPRMNEAALVAGVNPELDELEAVQAKKTETKSPPRDTVLQRAVDFITTAGVYGAGPGLGR